jgi:hypothetical protein
VTKITVKGYSTSKLPWRHFRLLTLTLSPPDKNFQPQRRDEAVNSLPEEEKIGDSPPAPDKSVDNWVSESGRLGQSAIFSQLLRVLVVWFFGCGYAVP